MWFPSLMLLSVARVVAAEDPPLPTPPDAEPAPVTFDLVVHAGSSFTLELPDHLGLAVAASRGPFWAELGGAAGVPQGPGGLDRTLVAIASFGGSPDFSRTWTRDLVSVHLGAGVGDPQRVARRVVGSPFLWAGGEVRSVRAAVITYDETAGYVEEDVETVTEVGGLLRAGVLVGVGSHAGVRLALEDRIRPERNLTTSIRHDTGVGIDLAWRF